MSTLIGRMAENIAANHLTAGGYIIAAQNWRTRWCEIDIVAAKDGIIYFVEVKYRRSESWGSGFEYITPKKLRQMHFAAQFWQARHEGANYRLAAIELTGDPPAVQGWLDDIS